MGRVDGKVALVTGAARGQGRSHARRLAEEGADIIAVDVCRDIETVEYAGARPEELKETAAQVEALDRRIVTREVDTRDFAGVQQAVQDGVSEFGRIDIVVANAGILTMARCWEITDEQWDTIVDVNLKGVWHAAKAAIPTMIEQGDGGSIIMTSSIAGLGPLPGMAHYGAAKHGVTGLARTMANELAEYSIRVNSVHPTSVHTPMIDNETIYRAFRPDLDNPTLEDAKVGFATLNKLPIPWVEPVDISNAVLYLASDEARYVTGVQLPVDGGWTQR
ncbi:mycofactocin-coupled SDR family oxidoreductase [Pseudonocardia endophytica]|uniref:SDR family mycofactocin-dependent oxidoreductase n=1 Tax=Pseudonocardia endophytica TaxID=401976 RepID=A0A4R1HEI1_PSEEN|nr:mycofactocin-coupled SDR family oxidoreductase [Pseudonocardia endophytica]TCK20008.1 SDR family mycofactocin-dependent oxidoreductase [Pseudonocardia endophytica]